MSSINRRRGDDFVFPAPDRGSLASGEKERSVPVRRRIRSLGCGLAILGGLGLFAGFGVSEAARAGDGEIGGFPRFGPSDSRFLAPWNPDEAGFSFGAFSPQSDEDGQSDEHGGRRSLNGHDKGEHRETWHAEREGRRRGARRYTPEREDWRSSDAHDDEDSDFEDRSWEEDSWDPESRFRFHDGDRSDGIALRTAFGFTLGPDTFLMTTDLSYFLSHEWSVGPLFQLGLSDDDFLLGATANFKRTSDLEINDEDGAELYRMKTYYNFGAGLVFLDEDRRGGADDDDAGLLLNVGFGLDFYASDRLSFGTGVLFNFMPSDVLDEHFFFSWQVATLSFHF